MDQKKENDFSFSEKGWGGIPQRLAWKLRQLWHLAGPSFPYLESEDDNSSPTSYLED